MFQVPSQQQAGAPAPSQQQQGGATQSQQQQQQTGRTVFQDWASI